MGQAEGHRMKIVCVSIDRFAAAIEVREHPELLALPVIIGGFPNERKPVFECSVEAANLDITPGMPLRQAHHICPDAVFIPLDTHKYTQAFDEVLDILDLFSPTIEPDALGRAFLDGSGLEGLFGPDKKLAEHIGSEIFHRTHLEPRIGIASNKLVAGTAADTASPAHPSVIEKGAEKEFLAPLPVKILPLSEETRRRFDLLGLRTVGQIAHLPLDALASQFGEEGVLAHRLANGKDERPLIPRARPAVLEQELCGENPLDTLDELLVALAKLLDGLIPALKARNQVCGQIRLCFHLDGTGSWQESITLKEPTDSQQAILTMLRHRLETMHLPGRITDVHLCLAQLGGEEARQDSLFSRERSRQEERLKRAAKHLHTRFGQNPLKKVVPVDPGSRIPERRSILTDYNP